MTKANRFLSMVIGAFLFITYLVLNTKAQTTIVVKSFPPVNNGGQIFISGTFNNWNPGDSAYMLKGNSHTKMLTMNESCRFIEAKFTLGSWKTVETDSVGRDIPNRVIHLNGDTVYICIEGWKQPGNKPCVSSASGNVLVLTDTITISAFKKKRTLRIYLPPDYYSTKKCYPVFYMHDGQNLFDNCSSFSGEWMIDETFNHLAGNEIAVPIVVGIDNDGANRLFEYSPWISAKYGGGGGAGYAYFIAKELKPFIDSTFRTLPDFNHTYIGGSSMGAFISLYIAIEYPDMFTGVLAFSPAMAFSDSVFKFIGKANMNKNIRFYFIAGTGEHPLMVPEMKKTASLIRKKGVPKSNIFIHHYKDGAHAEWFWAREFEKAYLWLTGN